MQYTLGRFEQSLISRRGLVELGGASTTASALFTLNVISKCSGRKIFSTAYGNLSREETIVENVGDPALLRDIFPHVQSSPCLGLGNQRTKLLAM